MTGQWALRCEPNVVILQLDRDCPCRRAADAGSSLPPPGSPSTEPSSCLAAGPIPPGSSVPNVAGGLVSSHAECTEQRKVSGASAPLGKREAQTLEPPGLAGCHTTLRAAMLARVCLPRAINSEQQQPAAANLTGFVESWPDKSWCGRVGAWVGGPRAGHLIAG